MTNEQQQVKDWMIAHGQDAPEKPTIPSFEKRRLRVKLMYEEFVKELSQALGVGIYVRNPDGEFDRLQDLDVEFWNDWGGTPYSSDEETKRRLEEILDGCEDLKVVTEGTLVACGLIKEESHEFQGYKIIDVIDPHFNEVMRSNWTKLWTSKEVETAYTNCKESKSLVNTKETGYVYCWDNLIATWTGKATEHCWLVKDKDGKVIKSPSYSPPDFKI
jgi:hypothetical protein